ncbi:MAG TPA: NAD(P)H-hydrate dehydratase [Conexibacter sp.]|jgi:NAD(P)H-hydrate epimerase|nr:NAD(P)H-hydrate dehydratase [Conexibacter sp.]
MTGLPAWLEPLPDAAAQRALDGWAIEQRRIPGLELMERAGHGLAELVAQHVPQGVVAVVCGRGNNGGDGFVAARLLREMGREVDVQLLGESGARDLTGDARANCERLPGAPPRPFNPGSLMEVSGVVDAVLGTGSHGVPRGEALDAVETMAAAAERGIPVVACDVPSGVDASTGEVAGPAVRAVATATFHAGKPGLWIAPGKQHAGEATVVEIGIPADGRPPEGRAGIGLIGEGVLDGLPARGAEATKFDGGSVLVCGGSLGLTGAPSMAAEAAARTGAGYVTALVPASLNLVFELRDAEVMSVPLADDDGSFVPAALDEALVRCERADALVLGPGLGRSEGAAAFARELALHASLPLLLDADGLNAHAAETALERLSGRSAPTVLTPHGGELARLLGVSGDDVRAARLASAREAARRSGAIVVLKGDDTLVVEPEGRVGVSRGDAPALATAGTGDVLSGVIGALLARGVEPFRAACAGVELHRRAGRLVGARVGVEGAMARDVIAALPYARRRD